MKKKSLLITLTAVMLSLALGIGGTIAYFTQVTGPVTNTFTSGNVAITLDEAPVTHTGDTWTADANATRVQSNHYDNIYPGALLPKDPTIHVAGTSQDAYVAMKVVVTKGTEWKTLVTSLDGIVGGFVAGDWERIAKVEPTLSDNTITYLFMYKGGSNAGRVAANANLTLFTSLTVPTGLTNAQLATVSGFTVTATGYAVQAQGLTYAAAQDQLTDLAIPAPAPAPAE